MRQDWQIAKPIINYLCLFFLLIFLTISGVPVIGYLVQIVAFFSVIYLTFEGMILLPAIGCAGSLVLSIMVFGFNPILLGMWVEVVVPGAILGRLMASGKSPSRAFTTAMFFLVAISIGIFWLEKDLIFRLIDDSKEMAALFFGNLETENNANRYFIEEVTGLFNMIRRLIPALMILSVVTQLFLGWIGLIYFLKIFGRYQPPLIGFAYWKMPYNYIYIVGIMIFLRLVGTEQIRVLADNSILFMGFFYALFGFSVLEYYLKKIRLSLFLRILFYIAFLPGAIVAILIGLFDSYFDFRKVRAKIIG